MFSFFINKSVSGTANKRARIITRRDRTGKTRTETVDRDAGSLNVAATYSPATHATRVFLDLADGSTLSLNGHEARTVYRILREHYTATLRSC